MEVLTSFGQLRAIQSNIVYAMGTFDGLHLGHRTVINKAVALAKANDAVTVVVTFDAHPLSVLAPERMPSALLQEPVKERLLSAMGIDYMLMLPMSRELLAVTAEDFLDEAFNGLAVKACVVGSNFSFGAGGKGTPKQLQEVGATHGCSVEILDLAGHEQVDGPISSTRIRSYIQEGRLEEAEALLGRPYEFVGKVIVGDQRGRILGFPTLNFLFPKEMTLPPDGVYVNRVFLDGQWFDGVGNMGDNPTFENQYHRFEVHLFDFNRDVYGYEARVEFLSFLRGEEKFSNLDDLIAQMKIDEQQARAFLKDYKSKHNK